MRTYVVGDVHGMTQALDRLLDKAAPVPGPHEGDRVVFVGDLIDKGPDSVGVIRRVRALRESGVEVVLVEGNHEEKHRRFRRNLAIRPQVAAQMGGAEEMAEITAGLSPEDVAFLHTAVPYVRLDGGFVVVHGGVPPALTSLDAPKAFEALCRTRSVSPETGEMLSLDKTTSHDPFWAEVYDGRFGHVLFGHTVFLGTEPRSFPHATGLDTGAFYGGALTAAILDEGKLVGFLTVPTS